MGKIYLVDSENVGDIWVPLLVSSQEDDEVLVFYTTKSPHMNYENVRMLKETEKEADFIKCFEGSNALDFQLVSELGYRLSQNADREYVIVSNDTGFDAAVRYWSTRKMPVSRLSGKECHRMLTEKKQRVAKESGAAAEPEQEQTRAAGPEVEAEQVRETGQEAEAFRFVGKEHLTEISVTETDFAVFRNGTGDAEGLKSDTDGSSGIRGFLATGLNSYSSADGVSPDSVLKADRLSGTDDLVNVYAFVKSNLFAFIDRGNAVFFQNTEDLRLASFVTFKLSHYTFPP